MKLVTTYCILCGNFLKREGLLCKNCLSKITPLYRASRRCVKCSKPLISNSNLLCNNCDGVDFHFEKNISLFSYQDEIISLLVGLFKFESNLAAGRELAMILSEEIQRFFQNNSFDFITCVPSSRISLRKRGFNPVEFVLDELKIPYTKMLKRKPEIKKQSELSRKERIEAIRNQFFIKTGFKNKILNKELLLIDDIFTTGSTVNEISRLLRENGAKCVNVLTFFRD